MLVLRQAGLVAVPVLLSEGLLMFYGALGRRAGGKIVLQAAELFAGAALCSSGIVLLYFLGTRDEK